MPQTPLQQLSGLMPLIEKMVDDRVKRIVTQMLTEAQYSVPKVADHHHNGLDSTRLDPLASISGYASLPSNSQATVAASGVVSAKALGDQNVTQGSTNIAYVTPGTTNVNFGQQLNAGSIITYPVPIIYGHGGGVSSAFNGGLAPEGTMLFFNNGATLSSFYIRSAGSWFGVHTDNVI